MVTDAVPRNSIPVLWYRLRVEVRVRWRAWLGLANTAVTDAGLAQIGKLTNLQSLDLHYTTISDAGVASLQSLLGKAPPLAEVEERFAARAADVWESEVAEVPAERRTVAAFADAWQRGDHRAMYDLLSDDAKKRTSLARLERSYAQAAQITTLQRVKTGAIAVSIA